MGILVLGRRNWFRKMCLCVSHVCTHVQTDLVSLGTGALGVFCAESEVPSTLRASSAPSATLLLGRETAARRGKDHQVRALLRVTS